MSNPEVVNPIPDGETNGVRAPEVAKNPAEPTIITPIHPEGADERFGETAKDTASSDRAFQESLEYLNGVRMQFETLKKAVEDTYARVAAESMDQQVQQRVAEVRAATEQAASAWIGKGRKREAAAQLQAELEQKFEAVKQEVESAYHPLDQFCYVQTDAARQTARNGKQPPLPESFSRIGPSGDKAAIIDLARDLYRDIYGYHNGGYSRKEALLNQVRTALGLPVGKQ